MDTIKLPAYRSSHLLRFHPYPRVKLSARERIVASTRENEFYQLLQMNSLHPESDVSLALEQSVHEFDVHNQPRQRRLSVSSLAVDLALLSEKKSSLRDD